MWCVFLFYLCGANYQYYGNSHLLVPFGTRLSVAQEVAWRLTAAGGRRREVDMALRSILCERSVRTNKIGHRKEKHDESDVAGIEPSWRSQKKAY